MAPSGLLRSCSCASASKSGRAHARQITKPGGIYTKMQSTRFSLRRRQSRRRLCYHLPGMPLPDRVLRGMASIAKCDANAWTHRDAHPTHRPRSSVILLDSLARNSHDDERSISAGVSGRHGGDVSCRGGPDHPCQRAADHSQFFGRARRYIVGRRGLSSGGNHCGAALRSSGGPVRAAAHAARGAGRFYPGVARLRGCSLAAIADLRTRGSRLGRRRSDDARPGAHRRARLAAGARTLLRILRHGLRARQHVGSRARCVSHRALELARGLCGQPAARRDCGRPCLACAAGAHRARCFFHWPHSRCFSHCHQAVVASRGFHGSLPCWQRRH